ncbi:putative secreted protein [Streptomyces ambofaciens ATCC 23877]|uniref:Putative secreted protein n=1 Tax=Streptomyces ambofaciens (strain ATCC 23877 / 3486 / DSM 40053 / JCM 4204 / NBRC 12836 / NRRL B-2516) TaxID=278992 RepID=A0ACS6_STRA7|nr:putative secreted protein [Streptomyces ambofaciens ATCC 23877]CAJ88281.1 putative secreted protein [Streptomyces ambofaciens ATCC 23877]
MKEHVVTAAKPHRKKFIARTLLLATAVGALAWGLLPTGAQGGGDSGRAVAVADEAPGYAVEDFAYPEADRILRERGIVLKRGDGHITLADCASGPGLLQVMARREDDVICFRTVGTSGWLTLEIPAVYVVRGNDYTTRVDMSVGDEEKSFDIEKNTWTSVGESADEQGREFMLMEIRTSK